jgi:ubiquinone/menaquinone biosynthesis C-methylase UbiE
VLLVLLLSYLYQGTHTLHALNQIERQRDHWQRPADVIQALNLREGSVVVDFGSGVGYFALKLSPLVGKSGSVVEEDIRWESLVFLRIRAFMRGQSNLRIIRGEIDDPRLPVGFADAIPDCEYLSRANRTKADPAPLGRIVETRRASS